MILLLLLSAGCASAPAETTRYLLRPATLPASGVTTDGTKVGIGSVQVASYLDQPGIVLETAPLEVHPAYYHEWAEPLGEGVRRYLRTALSRDLGFEVADDSSGRRNWSYEVRVTIDEFHGTLSGEARLVAAWQILPQSSATPLHAARFVDREPLGRDGYAGLVEAERRLLDRFAKAIAAAIRALPSSDS
jgi:uncharacterized lipoprotein YmbA